MGVFGSWVLAHGRLVKFASLSTAETVAADMPLSYLISSDQPTDRCRFTDVTGPITFDIDLTVPMAAQGVTSWRLMALLFNNSSSTGTWSVIGAATPAGITSPTYSSGTMSLWPSPDLQTWPRIHSRLWVPAGRTEKFLRVTVNDTTPRRPDETSASGFSTATYFDIGNLLVDFGYTTGDAGGDGGVLYSSPIDGLKQDLRVVVAEGGPKFPRQRPMEHMRSFELVFTGPNAATEYYAKMSELRRYVGQHAPVYLAEDLTATTFQMDKQIFGLMHLSDVSIPQNGYYHVLIRIEEML